MKKVSMLLVLMFSTALSYAQFNNKISVSFGPSFPVGKFADTDLFGDGTGAAKAGFSGMINFNRKVNEVFGYEIAAYGQMNYRDRKSIEEQLAATGFPFGPGNLQRYYSSWKAENSKWMAIALMAGFFADIPVTGEDSKFFFQPKVLAGVTYAGLPALYAESKSDTAYAFVKSTNGKGIAPVLMLGAELNYYISPSVSIFFRTDFFGSNHVRFKDVELGIYATDGGLVIPGLHTLQNSKETPLGIEGRADEKQTITGLNTRIGISFSF